MFLVYFGRIRLEAERIGERGHRRMSPASGEPQRSQLPHRGTDAADGGVLHFGGYGHPADHRNGPRLRLTKRNRWHIHYILARITAWLDQQLGSAGSFGDYFGATDRRHPFEVEHIWADRFDRHSDDFDNPDEFQRHRNRIGALLLGSAHLPRGVMVPVPFIAAAAAGPLWASIAGVLKARYDTDEIITTVMINFIILLILSYLLGDLGRSSDAFYFQAAAPGRTILQG